MLVKVKLSSSATVHMFPNMADDHTTINIIGSLEGLHSDVTLNPAVLSKSIVHFGQMAGNRTLLKLKHGRCLNILVIGGSVTCMWPQF